MLAHKHRCLDLTHHLYQKYLHEAGRKLPEGYTVRPVASIELACAVRHPGPCVRAVWECVALLLSRNLTCVRPPCTARPSEDFPHTSQCRLHIVHFTSHTSSHLKLHFSVFSHSKLLHRNAFTQRGQKLLRTSPYTEKLLHR